MDVKVVRQAFASVAEFDFRLGVLDTSVFPFEVWHCVLCEIAGAPAFSCVGLRSRGARENVAGARASMTMLLRRVRSGTCHRGRGSRQTIP